MQKTSDYLTGEEITRILDSAAKHSYRNYLMIKLMWQCGLRVREVSDLVVGDINFTNKKIKIGKSMNNKDRYIPITADLLKELGFYTDSEKIEKGYIFLSARKKPISMKQIQQLVERYVEEAKIQKHVTAHSFRQSFAISFLKETNNLHVLKQILGHYSIM